MNKEQAKQELHNLAFPKFNTIPEKLNISDVLRIVEQIDESLKVTTPEIPKWMAEMIKDSADFGGLLLKAEAVDGELKGSIIDYNLLAEAWVRGYTVEEPIGLLLVDMPAGSGFKYIFLAEEQLKTEDGWEYFYVIKQEDFLSEVLATVTHAVKVTEAEAKEKYPNFKWVSLEELENEGYGK